MRDNGKGVQGTYVYKRPLSERDKNSYVAAEKALSYLMTMDKYGSVGVEKTSVYGAAIAIPQVARSAGWSGNMINCMVKSYVFLILNILLQGFLLSMISQNQHIMNPFSGEMHLCDFGKDLQDCPNHPNCQGPGGTQMNFPRLYDYDTWTTRMFVRDSLKALFPERADEIQYKVDPGEFGLESYECRLVCIFLYAMSVIGDLNATTRLAELFYYLPSKDEKWLRYELPDWDSKEHAKQIFGWSELNFVKFSVSGMPTSWKVLNFFIIFVPKVFLWYMSVSCGFTFLMETSGIVDVIMNSLAMSFILDLDEMIFDIFTTVPVRHIMENLEDYDLFNFDDLEDESDELALQRYQREQLGTNRWWSMVSNIWPKRLVLTCLVMGVFLWKYYRSNCVRREDGSQVGIDMYIPKHVSLNPWVLFFDNLQEKHKHPAWTMPS